MGISSMKFNIGDVIVSKKPHACKGKEWEIVRTGADYKLKCKTCLRTIFLLPDELVKFTAKIQKNGEN